HHLYTRADGSLPSRKSRHDQGIWAKDPGYHHPKLRVQGVQYRKMALCRYRKHHRSTGHFNQKRHWRRTISGGGRFCPEDGNHLFRRIPDWLGTTAGSESISKNNADRMGLESSQPGYMERQNAGSEPKSHLSLLLYR